MHPNAPNLTWRAVPEEFGAIADHFRLPWRFHARVTAPREPLAG